MKKACSIEIGPRRILFGTVTFVNLKQLSMNKSPKCVIVDGIVISCKLIQILKTNFPIETTLSGIVIDVKFLHLQNAPEWILVTLDGIVKEVLFDSMYASVPIANWKSNSGISSYLFSGIKTILLHL